VLQVGTILFLARAAIAAIAVFVLTSATNAAITSLLMSVSIVGLFLAFFFSAVSLVYFGVVGGGGLTISSVAVHQFVWCFFSQVCLEILNIRNLFLVFFSLRLVFNCLLQTFPKMLSIMQVN